MSKDKRTYRDRAEQIKRAVSKRRIRLKQMAVEYAGGKCKLCGYARDISALEFHHLDPSKKDFGLGLDGLTRSWERTKAEVDKCILVCANCHREIHSGIAQLPGESQVDKLGELREAYTSEMKHGNPQPSLFAEEGSETR